MAIYYSSFKEDFHLLHEDEALLSNGPKDAFLSKLLFVKPKFLTLVSGEDFSVPFLFIWVSFLERMIFALPQ